MELSGIVGLLGMMGVGSWSHPLVLPSYLIFCLLAMALCRTLQGRTVVNIHPFSAALFHSDRWYTWKLLQAQPLILCSLVLLSIPNRAELKDLLYSINSLMKKMGGVLWQNTTLKKDHCQKNFLKSNQQIIEYWHNVILTNSRISDY